MTENQYETSYLTYLQKTLDELKERAEMYDHCPSELSLLICRAKWELQHQKNRMGVA